MFLQTGHVQCDVYVVLFCEISDRLDYWLLLIVAYSLVIANAKLQEQYDSQFISLCIGQLLPLAAAHLCDV